MARPFELIVLFSGEGTNLQKLIERFHRRRLGPYDIRVTAITNNPEAGGIARARKLGVEPLVIDHRDYPCRESFDEALVAAIAPLAPRLVVMAGFMRILTPVFTSRIEAINLHPSLLPLFKGADALARSFYSGMKVGGVTVHRVTAELDSGEILAQSCVKIEPSDTLKDFARKIHDLEHRLLPETVEAEILKTVS